MFSPNVVKTDSFMEMPESTKNLYFYLNLEADDDGFISNPKSIIRMCGAKEDDYKILIAKRFVIVFEGGVCVIKHWLIHNLIRADRYTETQWIKEKALLNIEKTTKKYQLATTRQPDGTTGKVRLGKVSKVKRETSLKNSLKYLDELPEDDLKELYVKYEGSISQIKQKAEDLANWCRSNGKIKKDYRSFLLTALNKDFPKRNSEAVKKVVLKRERVEKDGQTILKMVPNEYYEVAKAHKLI